MIPQFVHFLPFRFSIKNQTHQHRRILQQPTKTPSCPLVSYYHFLFSLSTPPNHRSPNQQRENSLFTLISHSLLLLLLSLLSPLASPPPYSPYLIAQLNNNPHSRQNGNRVLECTPVDKQQRPLVLRNRHEPTATGLY